MIGYISYFKRELISGLQYRKAAIAGLTTQVFWAFLYIMIYIAFFNSSNTNVGINLKQLVTYTWLNQAFYALIYLKVKDPEIMKSIKTGTVAYELCRPYDIYNWWYIKLISKKYAAVILRFLPIIILGFIVPKSIRLTLPLSFTHFILFFISLILGAFIVISIAMIVQIVSFYTNQDSGISSMVMAVGGFFAGYAFPLPLMPNIVQYIGKYLPFGLVSDFSFRVYSGNISINESLSLILLQLIWIIVLTVIGKFAMKRSLKKVFIQGG